MGLIESGKGFQFTVQGVVPPGVDETEMAEFIRQSVSYSSKFAALIRKDSIAFGTVEVGKPGLKLEQ